MELADIETQIEVLHSHPRGLHEKHRAARSKRNHIHNILIHQLPLEIVSRIFTLCLPPHESHDFSFKSEDFPFTISAVCQAWRALALSTPSLWSRPISVNVITSDVAHINHCLVYSGSLPISIRLYSDIPPDSATPNTDDLIDSTEIMCLIKNNLHRADYLCLDLSDDLIERFNSISNCPSSTPLLQELHVHCPEAWGSSKLKLSTTVPRPRTVCASAYYANFIDLDWDNVYDLTLKQTTIGCSLVLLSMAKRLVDVTLDIVGEDSLLTFPNTPIVHHSIRNLTLNGVEAADIIFSFTTITSLDSLSISCSKDFLPISLRFATFLQRSSFSLRCLDISFLDHFTGRTLMNVLSKIPTLQELTIADDFNGTEAKAIESLLERLSLTQSSGDSTFLPLLRKFAYTGSPVLPFNLLLDIFPADTPGEDALTLHPTRALQEVDIRICSNLIISNSPGRPLMPEGDIQRILQLRKAGKHISISEGTIDVVEWSITAVEKDTPCIWQEI